MGTCSQSPYTAALDAKIIFFTSADSAAEIIDFVPSTFTESVSSGLSIERGTEICAAK